MSATADTVAAEVEMNVTLQRAGEHAELIRHFRTEISALIGVEQTPAATDPLPYGLYLFVAGDGGVPVGMAEFYFYDDAFSDYRSCVYNRAFDLAKIAPMHEMIHLRSLYLGPERRNSVAFLYLVASLVDLAVEFGARFMTAGTAVDYAYVVRLHRTARMCTLGTYEVDGSQQALALMDLAPVARRARMLTRRAHVTLERTVASDLEPRRARVSQVREGRVPFN
jgi:hypothetical protein